MTDLIVVAGPIAGGKSTLAAALTAQLRERGAVVDLVGLDEVADMADRTDWAAAHAVFASVVAQWLDSKVDVVVAEGPGSAAEVDAVLAAAAPDARVLVCAVESGPEVALSRVATDPTRGISRDPEFLAREHERWARERLRAHVRIDTGETSVAEAVAIVEVVLAPAGR